MRLTETDTPAAVSRPAEAAPRLAIILTGVFLVGVLVWRGNHTPRDGPHAVLDPGFMVDVNRADAATLQLLPGLGPSIAENVVKHRETAGPFRRAEELEQVRMIGPVLRERMTPWITLGPPADHGGVKPPAAMPLSPYLNPKSGDADASPR